MDFRSFAESMLTEADPGKVFDAKYNGKIEREMYDKLVALDPTNEKKYINWIVDMFIRGDLKEEDFYKVTEYLKSFAQDRIRKNLPNKDIGFYKTLPELFSALQPVLAKAETGEALTSNEERKKNSKLRFADDPGIEVIAEDPIWVLFKIKDYDTACKYGSNTGWCTIHKHHYDGYVNQHKAPLYIVLNKNEKTTGEKEGREITNRLMYQMHFPIDGSAPQFKDISDAEVNMFKVGLSNKMLDAIVPMFKPSFIKHNFGDKVNDIEFLDDPRKAGEAKVESVKENGKVIKESVSLEDYINRNANRFL